jgi:hypothetical protein
LFLIGPSASLLLDDKKPEHHTSTIANIVADENVVNDYEREKYYQ